MKYRIKIRLTGFEPQMQYKHSMSGRLFWTPLNRMGYWAEPGSYSTGVVVGKYPLSFLAARQAIQRARLINDGVGVVRAMAKEIT